MKINKNKDNLQQLEHLLKEVLALLDDNPDRNGLLTTANHWAKSLLNYTNSNRRNIQSDVKEIFKFAQANNTGDPNHMITVCNIEFTSLCEHHLSPFRGIVHIGYIPDNDNIITNPRLQLTQLVDVHSRQLQLQERMTQDITRDLEKYLDPSGAFTMIQAKHFCISQRGVEQRSSNTITTARMGNFVTCPQLEERFYEKIQDAIDIKASQAKRLVGPPGIEPGTRRL